MTLMEALSVLEMDPSEAIDPQGRIESTVLRRQFRKLALKYHPDKNGGSMGSNDAFRHIAAAYEYLRRDEDGRGRFDATEFESCCSVPRSEELDEILARAMKGEDVEHLLRSRGTYRPPPNFGVFPFPKWGKSIDSGTRYSERRKNVLSEEYTPQEVGEMLTKAFAEGSSDTDSDGNDRDEELQI